MSDPNDIPVDDTDLADLERLVWLEIDHQLGDAERRRLTETLARSREAWRVAAEVRDVASLLELVEPLEPPAGLRASIERSVRALRPSGVAPSTPAAGARLRPGAGPRRLAIAAGLVLALGLAALATLRLAPTVEDPTTAAGAIAGEARPLVVPLADRSGSLSLSRVGDRVRLELAADPDAGRIGIALEAGGLRLHDAGRARVEPGGGDRLRATLSDPGPAILVVEAPEGSTLRVTVSATDRALPDRALPDRTVPVRTLLDRTFELDELPRTGR